MARSRCHFLFLWLVDHTELGHCFFFNLVCLLGWLMGLMERVQTLDLTTAFGHCQIQPGHCKKNVSGQAGSDSGRKPIGLVN